MKQVKLNTEEIANIRMAITSKLEQIKDLGANWEDDRKCLKELLNKINYDI